MDAYCVAQFYDSAVPLELAVATAVSENPANARSATDTPTAVVLDKLTRAESLDDEMRALLPTLALETQRMWRPGRQLSVSFIGGSQIQRDKVQHHVIDWQLAWINFVFVPDGQGQLRISFNPGSGSWSYLGTDALTVAAPAATMNYGWVTDNSDPVPDRAVILHEFGHALGCVHEHESPASPIQWNRPVVNAALSGPPNNWSQAQIDANIYHKLDQNQSQFTRFDPTSIMIYAIPASWTLDGYSVAATTDLSATDIAFIQQEYPSAWDGEADHIAFAADATALHMFALRGEGVAWRRRVNGTWDGYDTQVLDDTELVSSIAGSSYNGNVELLAIKGMRPRIAAGSPSSDWAWRDDIAPEGLWVADVGLSPPDYPGALHAFVIDTDLRLDLNYLDGGWHSWSIPFNRAPPVMGFASVWTRFALEIMAIRSSDAAVIGTQRPDSTGMWTPWAVIGDPGIGAAQIHSVRTQWNAEFIVIDKNGGFLGCSCAPPASERAWSRDTIAPPVTSLSTARSAELAIVATITTDGAVMCRVHDNWNQGWYWWNTNIGPGARIPSAPSAIVANYTAGLLELIVLAANSQLYHRTKPDGASWTEWSHM